ncbi:MAG: hypothetical protein GY895_06395 [Phycisphaera sp.]|nr:hypothetical protein [Phycisphaera sp.]
MGNTFFFIIAIAVIQAIVGGIAKAKEKRKKAEARLQRETARASASATSSASSPPPPTSPVSRQKKTAEDVAEAMISMLGGGSATSGEKKASRSSRSKNPDLDELRRRRIEALRRRQGAPVVASSSVSAEPSPAAPVAAPQAPTPPQPRTAVRAPSPPPARPRASDAGQESRERAPRTRTPRERIPASNKAKNAVAPTKPAAVGTAGIASRLHGNLSDPRQFREALLLAELLQPPVSMRDPASRL